MGSRVQLHSTHSSLLLSTLRKYKYLLHLLLLLFFPLLPTHQHHLLIYPFNLSRLWLVQSHLFIIVLLLKKYLTLINPTHRPQRGFLIFALGLLATYLRLVQSHPVIHLPSHLALHLLNKLRLIQSRLFPYLLKKYLRLFQSCLIM